MALGLEQAPGKDGLFQPGGEQVDVGPAGEAVFRAPSGFTVANQNEFVHVELKE